MAKRISRLEPSMKCSFREYSSNFEYKLFNHVRTHTKDRLYKCPEKYCNSAFTHQPSLKTHQLVHKKDDESLYEFKCSKCPYKTMVNGKLKRHLQIHSDLKEFSCELCPFPSKQKENLTRHHKSVHLKLKPFKCTQPNCNYASSQKSDLTKHQIVHKDKNDETMYKFKCTECPFKTSIKGYLTQHLVVHSEVKQFECELCPFRTKSKPCLNSHNKSLHSTLKPFKCPNTDCNFFAKTSSEVTRHVKVHVDEKPLSCGFPDCTFSTKWKVSLKHHEMVHRGEKPYKCSLCPKEFSTMGNLNTHFRRHTGETPYPCPTCRYRAKSSINLSRHLKKCKLETNGGINPEICLKKEQPLIEAPFFGCKVTGCEFLTQQNTSIAIHYNNIHNLPRVDLTPMEIQNYQSLVLYCKGY